MSFLKLFYILISFRKWIPAPSNHFLFVCRGKVCRAQLKCSILAQARVPHLPLVIRSFPTTAASSIYEGFLFHCIGSFKTAAAQKIIRETWSEFWSLGPKCPSRRAAGAYLLRTDLSFVCVLVPQVNVPGVPFSFCWFFTSIPRRRGSRMGRRFAKT